MLADSQTPLPVAAMMPALLQPCSGIGAHVQYLYHGSV
jgi:hypothetical protein